MFENNHFDVFASLPIDKIAIAEAKQKILALTKRELEILHLIVAGEQNKVIANKLCLSQRTVENHRNHIMDKTGCHSQPALTCLFMLSVKECLPHCSITKKCNHTYNDCPIEHKMLKPQRRS